MLALAAIYTELIRNNGWKDLSSRLGEVVHGLRRDLETNPFDKWGHDMSEAIRFGIRVAFTILDTPQRFIDDAKRVDNAVRRGK